MKTRIRERIEAARLFASLGIPKDIDPGDEILRRLLAAAAERDGKIALWETRGLDFGRGCIRPKTALIVRIIKRSKKFRLTAPDVWRIRDWEWFTRADPKPPQWWLALKSER